MYRNRAPLRASSSYRSRRAPIRRNDNFLDTNSNYLNKNNNNIPNGVWYNDDSYDSDYQGNQKRNKGNKVKNNSSPKKNGNKELSKIERTFIGAWENVKDVLTEPFVLVSVVAAMLVFFLSSETRIDGIVTDFFKSHNIPEKLYRHVPKVMHYLFAIAPLFSLNGRRRWGAFSVAGAICYVMVKEQYVAYVTLGVAVRLIFQSRTKQVGFMLLVAVAALLAVYHASYESELTGNTNNANIRSTTPAPNTRR